MRYRSRREFCLEILSLTIGNQRCAGEHKIQFQNSSSQHKEENTATRKITESLLILLNKGNGSQTHQFSFLINDGKRQHF